MAQCREPTIQTLCVQAGCTQIDLKSPCIGGDCQLGMQHERRRALANPVATRVCHGSHAILRVMTFHELVFALDELPQQVAAGTAAMGDCIEVIVSNTTG
jgi:hypothetical protein